MASIALVTKPFIEGYIWPSSVIIESTVDTKNSIKNYGIVPEDKNAETNKTADAP